MVRLRSSRRLSFLDLLTHPPWLGELLHHDMCGVALSAESVLRQELLSVAGG